MSSLAATFSGRGVLVNTELRIEVEGSTEEIPPDPEPSAPMLVKVESCTSKNPSWEE